MKVCGDTFCTPALEREMLGSSEIKNCDECPYAIEVSENELEKWLRNGKKSEVSENELEE